MKNNEMWIIKSGKIYLPYSVKSTRRECIEHFCIAYCCSDRKDIKREWEYRKTVGNSCVKIRVEEI